LDGDIVPVSSEQGLDVLNTENRKPETENHPSVYAVSLGCAKNLVDTEIMLGRLTQGGWRVAAAPEAAELLLVNTCAFIQDACQEAVDTVLELARHKEADPSKRLVAAAGELAAAGVKELILVAQDTTAYGAELPGHPGLPALLRELGAIPGFR